MVKRRIAITITIDRDRPRIRLEGDYYPPFYEWIKDFVSPRDRSFIKPCWYIDKIHFRRVAEKAYKLFDILYLIEDGRAEQYVRQKQRKEAK